MTLDELNGLIYYCDYLTDIYVVIDVFHVVYQRGVAKFEIYQSSRGNREFDVFAYRKVDDVWESWRDFPPCNANTLQGALLRAVGSLKGEA